MVGQPTLPIQFSVPVEARKDLRRLALDISDDIVPDGELRYTEMCASAALYLLTCHRDEVKRIINIGMAHEETYAQKAAAKADEPELKPSVPIKPPVNAARVWNEHIGESHQGDVKGLDRDRPARRQVRKSPPRK